MKGLDYRWLAALDAIVHQKSFEKAAEQLCITQSAVSQRIKQLEKLVAQPLLIREQPPKPTETGKKLLSLYQKVKLLEQETFPDLDLTTINRPLIVSLAVNADSLATWFLPAISPLLESNSIELNLLVEDETRTLLKLKNGEVVGALSTHEKPMVGCECTYLGDVVYRCVASPSFVDKYFKQGVTREAIMRAPAVSFDQHDEMHQQYLFETFNLSAGEWIKHTVRSSESFVFLSKRGVAYSLIPEIQVKQELASGELVDIYPAHTIIRPLYWHHWALESDILAKMTDNIIRYGRSTFGTYK